jgi:hypothetical protein
MYIVWRRRPVTSDRRTELFVEYRDGRVMDGEGNTVKPGRHKVGLSLDTPPWKPLWCEHRGPGRVAWTPLLMHAERVGGKPRQKLLRRLPTIRSCCLKDRFLRAAWWHDINEWARIAEEIIGWNDLEGQFIARDKRAILAKLRQIVPPPTAAGVRDFTAYRLEKEAEQKRLREECQPFGRQQADELHRRQEAQRRPEAEQGRRHQEELDKLLRAWGRTWGSFPGGRAGLAGGATVPECWSVLGVPPTATPEEVKARYRELARQHHPDRFGDEEAFKRVSAAYEQASDFLACRP